jgi:hypothetical protein
MRLDESKSNRVVIDSKTLSMPFFRKAVSHFSAAAPTRVVNETLA